MKATDIDQAMDARIAGILSDVFDIVRGPRGMQYYVGSGKDGYVYRLFNPRNLRDHTFDRFVLKVWNESFLQRQAEVDIHRRALELASPFFDVPRLSVVDFDRGGFVMERVPGKTAYRALFRERRFLTEEFAASIIDAFRALNEAGICHGDAHTGNYLFTEEEIASSARGPVLMEARLWIIDFGRSFLGRGNADVQWVQSDLVPKILKEEQLL